MEVRDLEEVAHRKICCTVAPLQVCGEEGRHADARPSVCMEADGAGRPSSDGP